MVIGWNIEKKRKKDRKKTLKEELALTDDSEQYSRSGILNRNFTTQATRYGALKTEN